jgi:hypothetical protein
MWRDGFCFPMKPPQGVIEVLMCGFELAGATSIPQGCREKVEQD